MHTQKSDLQKLLGGIAQQLRKKEARILLLMNDLAKDYLVPPALESRSEAFPLRGNIDVCELENELTLTAQLPGLEEKDIKVEFNNNILVINVEKKIMMTPC